MNYNFNCQAASGGTVGTAWLSPLPRPPPLDLPLDAVDKWKNVNILDLIEAGGDWVAVASAGLCANHMNVSPHR